MDTFLLKHQDIMKRVMTNVDQHDRALKSLSTWWEKIALVGKINSLEVASTILEDMDNTLGQFNGLQSQLIKNLINEHARKVIVQNTSRSQMGIDILIRNLFERTADIGFLSKDYDVIDFLKKSDEKVEDREFIEQRLRAYVSIYSVYNDALLLKPNGELVFQLSQPTRTDKVSDPLIQQAINSPDDYVEFFGETQLMGSPEGHLLYANAVVDNGQVVGVIVLCFRFTNELEGIVNRLLFKGEADHFLLVDGAGKVLHAPKGSDQLSNQKLSLSTGPKMISMSGQSMIEVCMKGQPYQEYAGPTDWHMCSLLPIEKLDENTQKSNEAESDVTSDVSSFTGIISEGLFDIRRQSVSINDDLQLIVLNGIITAARKDAVEFMPVLEAIKKIGEDINNVFADSIESLFSTIISGQLNAIQLQATMAVDIMDRNLFERANDSRWWALNSLLRRELCAPVIDKEAIKQTLATIHELYTVYHTLYVYDRQGRYVAFSDDQYNHKIGQNVEPRSGAQDAFKLSSIYEYSVSPFEPFDCYDGESTYIYNAVLRDMDSDDTVGGIGIVFDSTVEFKAILNDVLPHENGVIKEGTQALFTTEQGVILSSATDSYTVGDRFAPNIDVSGLQSEGSLATLVKIEDREYLVGAAKSVGYREYKVDDGYENTVIAWVLVPC